MIFNRSAYLQFSITLVLATLLLGAGMVSNTTSEQPDISLSRYAAGIWNQHSAVADTNEKIVFIEKTDKLSRSTQNGEPIQVLEGNVKLRQPGKKDTLHLWADKVVKYELRDEVLLRGRVLIVQNNDSLSADSVRYFSAPKKGQAMGNVRLSDGDVQVFAPAALHFFDPKHTIFDDNVRLVDSTTVLTSLDGEYFSEEKRAEFYNEVVLVEDNTYLNADTVTYYRNTEISVGRGNVFIERIGGGEDVVEDDSTTRTFLFGDHVYNDNRAGYSKMDGNAMLFQLKQDSLGVETDSLIMTAYSLEAIRDDSLQRLIAVDSVHIWRETFAAIADSAVYDRISIESQPVQEENRLYQGPIAWFETYQISGDSLRSTALDGKIDSFLVIQNAFAASEDTTTQKINQLKGEDLLGLFEADSLKSLAVGPQAEWIYFKMSQDNQLGAIKASGDRIELRFKGNDLDEIGAYQGIQGEYYDGDLIPESFELNGFFWRPERRPTRAQLLNDAWRLERIQERVKRQPEVVDDPPNAIE